MLGQQLLALDDDLWLTYLPLVGVRLWASLCLTTPAHSYHGMTSANVKVDNLCFDVLDRSARLRLSPLQPQPPHGVKDTFQHEFCPLTETILV